MADSSERELVEWRAKRKVELKKEFLKQFWDPHRHERGENIFDPALQRYMSMRACQYDYFKPTKKTGIIGLSVLIPFLIFNYFLQKDRADLRHKCSTGQIAYKDRKAKFLV